MGVAALITSAALLGLTPQQKAALVVVSGLPAPPGVAGVIVQKYSRDSPRPAGAFVVVDQEGGKVKTFRELPPATSARAMRSNAQAYAAGAATGRALRSVGVDIDLAPVLDLPDGPLGSRQFRSPSLGVAIVAVLSATAPERFRRMAGIIGEDEPGELVVEEGGSTPVPGTTRRPRTPGLAEL